MLPEMYARTEHLRTVRDNIAHYFDMGDFRNLCFDLGIDFDELPGEKKSEKVQSLLVALERRNRIPELIERLQQVRPNVDWEVYPLEPQAEAPFKGLNYFTQRDAHLFFGREDLIDEFVTHIRAHSFLAIVGASGSGKSSVLRAGVLPALNQDPSWLIAAPLSPGQDDKPLDSLAGTLLALLDPQLSETESLIEKNKMSKALRAGELSLSSVVNRIMHKNDAASYLLLAVDQFEELFTQCDDLDEQQLFVKSLAQSVQIGKQRQLSLILTLRADFYTHALQYPMLVPLLENQQKIVEAKTHRELRRAIEGPAEVAGWRFQPGLVDTIMADVGAGKNRLPEPGALPLLSHALLETWKLSEGRTMTLMGYREAGGVRQAIATTADAVYGNMNTSQQTIAQIIFLRLTELGEGTEDTRRRARLGELVTKAEAAQEVQEVLQLLIDARLVTTEEDSVAVAHEALMREWPMLREWLDADREGLRIHRHLTLATQDWLEFDHDPDLLYRGLRLQQVLVWAEGHADRLNQEERSFLQASEDEEETAQQRELEVAQRMVRLQSERAEALSKAANRLRWIVITLLGLLVTLIVIFILTLPTIIEGRSIQQARGEMVLIPGGTVVIGEDDGGVLPQRLTTLEPFRIGKFEVSNRQFNICANAGVCPVPRGLAVFDENLQNHPVVDVSLLEATTFCNWLGLRLPTNDEWERAARHSDGNAWPWGSEYPSTSFVNMPIEGFGTDGVGETQPVSSNPEGESVEGVHNLVGNVWEWTSSIPGYGNGEVPLSWDGSIETFGSFASQAFIIRGGSWQFGIEKITDMIPAEPHFFSDDIGFRCAESVELIQ